MKVESCRKCGTELEIKQSCSFCISPIQFHCKSCDIDTDIQIHTGCFQSSFDEQVTKIRNTIAS
jgi:hypothetical protein